MAKQPHLGSKVRRLRQARDLSQVEAATRLGISASYLNLIEHNQRPLTVALLFKVGQLFDIDLRDWSEGEEAQTAAAIREALNDPILAGNAVSDEEITEITAAAPNLSHAMAELYAAYRRALDNVNNLGDRLSEQAMASGATLEMRSVLTSIKSFSEILREHQDLDEGQRRQFLSILVDESNRLTSVMDKAIEDEDANRIRGALDQRQPAEEVSRFIERHNHHFPELESAAEELTGSWDANAFELPQRLSALLADRWRVSVSFSPGGMQGNNGRGPVAHASGSELAAAGKLVIDPNRPVWEISCELARHVAHLGHGDLIAERLGEVTEAETDRAGLLAGIMEDYFAAAILMPYGDFHSEAVNSAYDFEHLARRFRVPPRNAARRLTTLRRPGASGVAFHLLAVDVAGNVRERIPGSGMPLPRFGSACPRWNIHHTFSAPGQTLAQTMVMPDGTRFFCISRTDEEASPRPVRAYYGFGPRQAFALGCARAEAEQVSYFSEPVSADGKDETPVGINCRICPRTDCSDRAFQSAVTAVSPSPEVR